MATEEGKTRVNLWDYELKWSSPPVGYWLQAFIIVMGNSAYQTWQIKEVTPARMHTLVPKCRHHYLYEKQVLIIMPKKYTSPLESGFIEILWDGIYFFTFHLNFLAATEVWIIITFVNSSMPCIWKLMEDALLLSACYVVTLASSFSRSSASWLLGWPTLGTMPCSACTHSFDTFGHIISDRLYDNSPNSMLSLIDEDQTILNTRLLIQQSTWNIVSLLNIRNCQVLPFIWLMIDGHYW